jgi:hypothetical protein
MYGPASSDLVNARMADHRRYAKHVALENAAKRSRRVERLPRRSWHSEFIAFATATARRLAVLGKRTPVETPIPAARFKSATS